MFDVRTMADVRQDTGVRGPEELANRSPLYPVVLAETGVANGGTSTQSFKMPGGTVFAGFELTGVLILNAASGAAVDGSPLSIDGAATKDSNTMFPAHLVTVQILGSQSQLNNTPIPWPAIVGDARSPFIFPAPHYVNGGDEVRVQVYNGSGVAIDYTIVMWGRKITGA